MGKQVWRNELLTFAWYLLAVGMKQKREREKETQNSYSYFEPCVLRSTQFKARAMHTTTIWRLCAEQSGADGTLLKPVWHTDVPNNTVRCNNCRVENEQRFSRVILQNQLA